MPEKLLPTPHFKQQSESDCLVACAAMMLEAIEIQASYQQLASLLDLKSWGTPHRNILKLAEQIQGVQITNKQGALSDLFQVIDGDHAVVVIAWTGDLPYWDIETWHAVGLIGYDEQNFFVNDPAFDEAPQVVSYSDLDLRQVATMNENSL